METVVILLIAGGAIGATGVALFCGMVACAECIGAAVAWMRRPRAR